MPSLLLSSAFLIVIEWELGIENEAFYAVLARNSFGGLVRLSDVISRFDTRNTRFKILRRNRFPKNASSVCWCALYTLNFWRSFPVVCNAWDWSGENIVMDEKINRNESLCFITVMYGRLKWGDGCFDCFSVLLEELHFWSKRKSLFFAILLICWVKLGTSGREITASVRDASGVV